MYLKLSYAWGISSFLPPSAPPSCEPVCLRCYNRTAIHCLHHPTPSPFGSHYFPGVILLFILFFLASRDTRNPLQQSRHSLGHITDAATSCGHPSTATTCGHPAQPQHEVSSWCLLIASLSSLLIISIILTNPHPP